MEATAIATKFEIGQVVTAGKGSDYVWTFEVIKRTAKFVTLRDISFGPNGDTYRVGIKEHEGEYALPFGNYSMAPVVRPER